VLLGCVIDRGIASSTCDENGNAFSFEERLGNLTTNTWNGENRLVQVEHPGGDITTYTYNADGLRVREEHDGVETRFVYDGNNLLREADDTNLPEADYTYIPQAYAEAISQRRDGNSSFYLADGIRNAGRAVSPVRSQPPPLWRQPRAHLAGIVIGGGDQVACGAG
jgi:YD repeat-containing protein